MRSPSRTTTSPSRGLDRPSAADDQLDALRVEIPEGLVRAQERGDPLGVRLLAEGRGGLGVCSSERDRDAAVEPQDAHGARSGTERDSRWRLLDQRPLAARLPGAEHSERDLRAVRALGDDAHLALDDDDERAVLGRRDRLAEVVGALLEAGQDEVAHLRRQLRHEGQGTHHRGRRRPGRPLTFAHASAPSRRGVS